MATAADARRLNPDALPDLYKATDTLLDVLDYLGHTLPEDTMMPILAAIQIEETIAAAKAALAKAEGES